MYYDIYVSHFRGRGINSRTPSKSIDFSWRKIEREREREKYVHSKRLGQVIDTH